MILEVIKWPESQEVMENPDWFFVMGNDDNPIGDSAYARILDESEYMLIRNTHKVKVPSVPIYKEGDAEIVEKWICSICGEDTYDVDWQYIGTKTNHLGCELEVEMTDDELKLPADMKLKNPGVKSDKRTSSDRRKGDRREKNWLQKDGDLIVGVANED